MIKITSYFEVDSRARLAYDLDTGEGAPAYLMVATEHSKQLSDEEIHQVRDAHKMMVAGQLELPEEWLRTITQQEYEEQTEEE